MKIKLVAIAKDEAAYISEWIYHHLHFGFDSIDVYTNNISDNTRELIAAIGKNHDVNDIDADFILACSDQGFQRIAYGIALQKAKLDGYSHIMFLDVDEFWTPLDFKASIKDFLVGLKNPDIVSFPWALKVDTDSFSDPFEKVNRYVPAKLVKTVFKTSVNVSVLRIHNVVSKHSKSILPDGSVLAECGESVLGTKECFKQLPVAFISHRLCRGQMEFVSMLGKGVADTTKSMGALKSNRPPFIKPKDNDIAYLIEDEQYSKYMYGFNKFVEDSLLEALIIVAKRFVEKQYFEVIARFEYLNEPEVEKFKDMLRCIDLPEIRAFINGTKEINMINLTDVKDQLYVNDKTIDFLRDESLRIEKSDPELALSLMSIARAFRPGGPLLKDKVLKLREQLEN